MKKIFFKSMLLLCALIVGSSNVWADPVVLFHETFGDNSGSARDWNNSYSVKSGVSAVYSGISSYTVSNAKQGKNTTGSTKSGLNQSSQGTDAYIIIGPLNVESYESLSLTYQWKAASIKGTYSTSLYYATSSDGSYTEVSGTGTGATTFVERSYSLPAAAQVSTLYLKIVWNTSNTQAIIDEVDLQGVSSSGGGGGSSVAVPTISLEEGTYYTVQTVTLSCETEGATIYYTLDGTAPSIESTEYTDAISISSSCTLQAIAIKDEEESSVVSANYTLTCLSPTFSVAAGTYDEAQSVELSCETEGASIYYTLDGKNPTSTSTLYSSAISISKITTIKAIAIKDGWSNSTIATAAYNIFIPASLPFSFNYGKGQIATTTGLEASGLGSDYSTAKTKLKFDDTGDYLVLKIAEAPGVLSFNIKGNSFSGGTFKVQTSSNGEEYNDLKTYNSLGDEATESLKGIGSDVRYIRWIYTTKSSGNVGLGNINLGKVVSGTISEAGWTSFSNTENLDLSTISGGSAYVATDASGSIVTLSPIDEIVTANAGLMIKGTAGEDFTIKTTASAATYDEENLLKGQATTSNVAASGTDGKYHYIFGYKTSDPSICGFYNLTAPTPVSAGKAYLETTTALTVPQTGAPAIIRILDEENNATSIEAIGSEDKAVKFMENGQIYILREGVVYDALGRIVK